MHTYSYDISDQQILRDFDPKSHQSSLEVTRGQIKFVNCNQGPNFWHTYPYYISDLHRPCHITLKQIRGQQRSLEVKMRSNLKNVPRDPIFCKHTHMISLINIGYDVLAPEVYGGQKRLNQKNALREPIIGMHTNVVSLTNTGNGILTIKLIRGQQWSLEVKRRSKLKNTLRDSIFWQAYSYDIINQHRL